LGKAGRSNKCPKNDALADCLKPMQLPLAAAQWKKKNKSKKKIEMSEKIEANSSRHS